MWEFPSLPDAAVDVKITYTGNVWWHKGLTKHSVDAIFYTTPTPSTDQFLRNAGFEGSPVGPWTVTNVEQAVFGSWKAINGAGSSAVLSRETSITSADSLIAAKIVNTRVSGSFQLYENFQVPASMRNKQTTLSVQVHQSVADAVRVYLSDASGTAYSATSSTTGSYVTMTVTRTMGATGSVFQAGISVDLSATVYVDNAIWNLGAVAATYRPEYWNAGGISNDLLASGVAVANLGFTPVNKAGDTGVGQITMTGHLILDGGELFLNNDRSLRSKDSGGTYRNLASVNGSNQTLVGDASLAAVRLLASGNLLLADTHKIWHEGNDGSGSGLNADVLRGNAPGPGNGLDADTVDGNQATALLARANHTGTQAPATISPQGSGSGLNADTLRGNAPGSGNGLDADTVDGDQAATLKARANHTGTQLAATISDLASAVAGMTAASANAVADNSITTADLQNGIVTADKVHADYKDGSAGTVSLRSLGSGGAQAAAGNHSHAAGDAETLDGINSTGFLRLTPGANQTVNINGGATLAYTSAITGGRGSGLDLIGNILVQGNMEATGFKARVATGHDGRTARFHAQEAPYPYFEDFGHAEGQGTVVVEIPTDFANYVSLDDYYIFLTPYGDHPVRVLAKNVHGFLVSGGDGNPIAFDWRVVARQSDLMDVERLSGRRTPDGPS